MKIPEPEVESTTPEEAPSLVIPEKASPPITSDEVVVFKDKTPANWVIVELETGMIEAKNLVTAEFYEGNISNFNKALRG